MDIILIPSCEISFKDGHILAYGIKTLIPKGLSAERTVALIHKQKGIAVAAHPFMHVASVKSKVFDISFDAIECSNSAIFHSANAKAKEAASKLQIPGCGSDAHIVEDLGSSFMLFPESVKSASGVLRSIRTNKFSIREGRSNSLRMVLLHILRNITIQTKEAKDYLLKLR